MAMFLMCSDVSIHPKKILAPIIYVITTLYDSRLLHSAFNLDLYGSLNFCVSMWNVSVVSFAICSSLSILIDPLLHILWLCVHWYCTFACAWDEQEGTNTAHCTHVYSYITQLPQ